MSPRSTLVAGEAVGHRLGHGVGLLVDLLQHEGLVPVLLGRRPRPSRPRRLALDGLAVGVDEAGALRGDGDDLAVLDQLDVAGLRQEGGDGGGDEALALAHAHHQRALLAGADQHVRLVGGHRHEGVVAAQVVVGAADGLHEVAVEVLGDQVGHHLGVGLGGEVGAVVASSLSRSSVQFSTIPLSTMCTRSEVSECGWAFASVTRPWVAQRVWPMPVEPRRWPFVGPPPRRGGAEGCPRRAPSRSTPFVTQGEAR